MLRSLLIALAIFAGTSLAHAKTVPFKDLSKSDQVQVLKAYRQFVLDSEKKLLPKQKKTALLSLFSKAMAQEEAAERAEPEQFGCFFAGWPSKTRIIPGTDGNPKYSCGHPADHEAVISEKLELYNKGERCGSNAQVYCNPLLFGDKAGCVPVKGGKGPSAACETKGSVEDAIAYVKGHYEAFEELQKYISEQFCTPQGLEAIKAINVRRDQDSTCKILTARLSGIQEKYKGQQVADRKYSSTAFCSYEVDGKTIEARVQGKNLNLIQVGAEEKNIGSFEIFREGRNTDTTRGGDYKTIQTCLGPLTFAKNLDNCKTPYFELESKFTASGAYDNNRTNGRYDPKFNANAKNYCEFWMSSNLRHIFKRDAKSIFTVTPKNGNSGGKEWYYYNHASSTHKNENYALTEKTPGYFKLSACGQDAAPGKSPQLPFEPIFSFDNNTTDETKKCNIGFDWKPVRAPAAATENTEATANQ